MFLLPLQRQKYQKTMSDLTKQLRSGRKLTPSERLRLVLSLSWPAIMAQLSTILMEYIDAAMVGRLGAAPAASVGLMATTTWLVFGLGGALATGFSVQVAHLVGAGKDAQARQVLLHSLRAVIVLGLFIGCVGALISPYLPIWLGGNDEITAGATAYFGIFSVALPFFYITYLSSSMIRCTGNMIIPGALNVMMCVLDLVFNYFLIFDSHVFFGVTIPGAGLGVTGAALGTALAEILTGGALLWYLLRLSSLKKSPQTVSIHKISFSKTLKKALGIGSPIAAERVLMNGAQILTTVIVAPLGTVAIAANSFAITAESLCYMPGFGVGDAGTTLVGQSLGAGQKETARSFGKMSIIIGMSVMTIMGIIMWVAAPMMMSLFTPDEAVRSLGTECLRIEAYAEPMFAAAIVTYGVMVGAGYTLVPACVILGSMWAVRLSLAALLAPTMGLQGVWLAMCIELTVRGAAFLIIFNKAPWMRSGNIAPRVETEEVEQTENPL